MCNQARLILNSRVFNPMLTYDILYFNSPSDYTGFCLWYTKKLFLQNEKNTSVLDQEVREYRKWWKAAKNDGIKVSSSLAYLRGDKKIPERWDTSLRG